MEFQRVLIMEGSRRKKSPVVLGTPSGSTVSTLHDMRMAEIASAVFEVVGGGGSESGKGLLNGIGKWRRLGFEVCLLFFCRNFGVAKCIALF